MQIEDVLKALGITARRRGKEWNAQCPDPRHEDRKPSWSIHDSPDDRRRHGMHLCMSCGFSGDLPGLVMDLRKVGYREARAWLEGEEELGQGAPSPYEVEFAVTKQRHGFRIPPEVEFRRFEAWVTPAREYVLGRGMPVWQVDRWGLGYAVDGRLGGRVVVPYRDARGQARGYTARTFVGAERRYLEPMTAEGADPSVMFGEQYWPSVSRETETVFVAEGALNAMALERALGKPYVAATAGSSLRAGHALKLSTFHRVVVLSDPDAAGDKVAREIAAQLARHARVVRVRLRAGVDAADTPLEELRKVLRKV